MKYMLLIYLDEQNPLSEVERQECYAESTQLAQELNKTGKYLSANPLHPTSMATSVRVRNGKRLVTDGPFAETREQLGGYFLIDAKDLYGSAGRRRACSDGAQGHCRGQTGYRNSGLADGITKTTLAPVIGRNKYVERRTGNPRSSRDLDGGDEIRRSRKTPDPHG